MSEQGSIKKRSGWAVLLTLLMVAVWCSLTAEDVYNALQHNVVALTDRPSRMLKLEWLAVGVTSVPCAVLTKIPPDAVLFLIWRVSVALGFGYAAMATVFEWWPDSVGVLQPSMGTVVIDMLVICVVCGPAVWFNIIKPVPRVVS